MPGCSPMASDAFVIRFMITCCTWPASALTGGNARSRSSVSVAIFDVLLRSRWAFSSTSWLRSTALMSKLALPE